MVVIMSLSADDLSDKQYERASLLLEELPFALNVIIATHTQ